MEDVGSEGGWNWPGQRGEGVGTEGPSVKKPAGPIGEFLSGSRRRYSCCWDGIRLVSHARSESLKSVRPGVTRGFYVGRMRT